MFTVAICDLDPDPRPFREFHQKNLNDTQQKIEEIYQTSGMAKDRALKKLFQGEVPKRRESEVNKVLQEFSSFYDILETTNGVIERSLLTKEKTSRKEKPGSTNNTNRTAQMIDRSMNFSIRDMTSNSKASHHSMQIQKNSSPIDTSKQQRRSSLKHINLFNLKKVTQLSEVNQSPERGYFQEENTKDRFASFAFSSEDFKQLVGSPPKSPTNYAIVSQPTQIQSPKLMIKQSPNLTEPNEIDDKSFTFSNNAKRDLSKKLDLVVETNGIFGFQLNVRPRSPEFINRQTTSTPERQDLGSIPEQESPAKSIAVEPYTTNNSPVRNDSFEPRTEIAEVKPKKKKRIKIAFDNPLPRKISTVVKAKERVTSPFYQDSVAISSPTSGRLKANRLVYVFDKVAEVVNTFQAKDPTLNNLIGEKDTEEDLKELEVKSQLRKRKNSPNLTIQQTLALSACKKNHMRRSGFEDGLNFLISHRRKTTPSIAFQSESLISDFNAQGTQFDPVVSRDFTTILSPKTEGSVQKIKFKKLLQPRPSTAQSIRMNTSTGKLLSTSKTKDETIDYSKRLRLKIDKKHEEHSQRLSVNIIL